MNLKFKVRRDCNQKKLRKVVIELFNLDFVKGDEHNTHLMDRCRMFAGPFFAKRLARKQMRMLRRAKIMSDATLIVVSQ